MLKKIRTRLIVGSVLFGLVVFGKELFNNGNWNPEGIIWVIYGACSFGILFYVIFRLIMKKYDEKEDTMKKKK